jgi:fructokinase
MARSEILCVGEVLWDALPAGLFLGGVPFNVACHLRAAGLPATLVSRVGSDLLGEEVRRRVARYGVGTELLQVDPALPTGFVRVELDEAGLATYEIVDPAAWDAVEVTDALLERASAARMIVFGSLAQRHAVTRASVERLWDVGVPLAFDVSLRPPYGDREVVRRSLQRAAVVKLTEAELAQLAAWFRLEGAGVRERVEALAAAFGCGTICVTRGRHGAGVLRAGRWTEHPGYEVEVRDSVGAGDAFFAILLAGILKGVDDRALLRDASLMGAYVATQSGAVPPDQPEAPVAPAPDADR